MTRATLRKQCAVDGCPETAFYDFSSQRERREHVQRERGRDWRCTRHTNPDAVLTPENASREVTLTAERSKQFPDLDSLFWREDGAANVGSGFMFGPGFKAWANDFAEGTHITITVTATTPPATNTPDRRGSEGES